MPPPQAYLSCIEERVHTNSSEQLERVELRFALPDDFTQIAVPFCHWLKVDFPGQSSKYQLLELFQL